LKTQK